MKTGGLAIRTNRTRIHLYANCWNEIRLLPYFMRHYAPFITKFFILDDGSTDGSVDFLTQQANVELLAANRKGNSYIEQTRNFFNEAWKESRHDADWIITCNIDEHLYHHHNIEAYLQRCQQDGITILRANGHEMVSLHFPTTQSRLCDSLRFGVPAEKLTGPSSLLTKIMVFNPLAIEEMNFSVGRHEAEPTGRVTYPDSIELKLLHYKFLGANYAIQRYAELRACLSSADRQNGRGSQYLWEARMIRQNYEVLVIKGGVVAKAGWIEDAKLWLAFLPYKLIFLLRKIGHRISSFPWPKAWRRLLSAGWRWR